MRAGRIEPEVGPTQIKFVDVATVVARLQQQYDLDLRLLHRPADYEAGKRGERTANPPISTIEGAGSLVLQLLLRNIDEIDSKVQVVDKFSRFPLDGFH